MSNAAANVPASLRRAGDTTRSNASKQSRPTRDSARPINGLNPLHILLYLVAFRILNALCVRTFFQPDEFFQSLEPAWQIAFGGDSGAWITWEWKHQLRSSIHPYLFAAVYRISVFIADALHLLPFSRAELLIAAPKVTQAVFAALGDYYTWKLARKSFGAHSAEAWWTLGLTVLSPWQWFCSTRTLSNCLETTLTITALYLWPWHWLGPETQTSGSRGRPRKDTPKNDEVKSLRKCLLLAALGCVLRPTNLIIWLCLITFNAFNDFIRTPVSLSWKSIVTKPVVVILREALYCGTAILFTSVVADRAYYGEWTLPPLRFLYFNIAQSLAVFYGKNDWHYYASQGYPLLLTTALPFAIMGIIKAIRGPSFKQNSFQDSIPYRLATICIMMPLVLSFISHKEVRFIYPLLPSLHILAASPLSDFFSTAVTSPSKSYTPRRLSLVFIILLNISIAIYTTFIHASGALNVLSYLRDQNNQLSDLPEIPPPRSPFSLQPPLPVPTTDRGITAGFLMPCHSTPWRSHLLSPSIHAWALSCEPPVNLNPSERSNYVDEADQFYENPTEFLRRNMIGGLKHFPQTPSYLLAHPTPDTSTPTKHEWPDYLAFFSQLEPTLRNALAASPYAECHRTFNTAWHDDWRRKGDIIVWCLDPAVQQSWRIITTRTKVANEKKKQQKHFDRIVDRLAKEASTGSNSWWSWWPGQKKKQSLLPSSWRSFSMPRMPWEAAVKQSRWPWSSSASRPTWSWQVKRKKTWSESLTSVYEKLVPRRRRDSSESVRDLWS